MAKKIRYSEPLAELWDGYNKINKKTPISHKEFIHQWIHRDMISPFHANFTQAHIFVGDMFYADSIKKFLHLYFVDSSLRDFLMDMPIKDFKGLTDYIIENGEVDKAGAISLMGTIPDENSKISNFCFGIHIPYENKYRGYAFSFTYDFNSKQLLFAFAVEDGCSYITLDHYEDLCKKNTPDAEKTLKYLRLAINTIIYMHTFPDCIVDGTPDEVKNEYSKKLTISEKVLEAQSSDSSKSVRPHFRRGFFKRLTSDFYTKKKGQTVFVSPTMVNGVAKTVYTSDKLEEFCE